MAKKIKQTEPEPAAITEDQAPPPAEETIELKVYVKQPFRSGNKQYMPGDLFEGDAELLIEKGLVELK